MRPKTIGAVAATLCMFSIWSVTGMANAAEIKVLSSNAIKEAYLEFSPHFEHTSGHKLVTVWNGTADILKKLQAGEVHDLIILATPSLEDMIKQGKIVAGSRVDLVKSGVGVAVRTGAAKPDISSSDTVKKALLGANGIGYSTGPSGVYLEGLFQRMGIADAVKAKLKRTQPGVPVGSLLVSGEADIGFQQVSELLLYPGIQYVGPLPADIQHITVFSGGIHVSAKEPEGAKALVKFITSPEALPAIKKSGMEPG
jgi:molybdate transport system substrate-binding protein